MSSDHIWPILFFVSLAGNLILLFYRPLLRLLRRGEEVSEDEIMAMVEDSPGTAPKMMPMTTPKKISPKHTGFRSTIWIASFTISYPHLLKIRTGPWAGGC